MGMGFAQHDSMIKKVRRDCEKEKAVLFHIIKRCQVFLLTRAHHFDATDLLKEVDTVLALVPQQPSVDTWERPHRYQFQFQKQLPLEDRHG